MGNDVSGNVRRDQLHDDPRNAELMRRLFRVPDGVGAGERVHTHGLALARYSVLRLKDEQPWTKEEDNKTKEQEKKTTKNKQKRSKSNEREGEGEGDANDSDWSSDDETSDSDAMQADEKKETKETEETNATKANATALADTNANANANSNTTPADDSCVQQTPLWRDIQHWLHRNYAALDRASSNTNTTTSTSSSPRHFTVQQDRAMAVMLGNAIGDSLGAPLEFSSVQYGVTQLTSFDDPDGTYFKPLPKPKPAPGTNDDNDDAQRAELRRAGSRGFSHYNSFSLHAGQWTDDNSMALCMSESLLACGRLHLRDMRLRFLNWWRFGYNTAFGWDACHRGSVGLGGNISSSFAEFTDSNGASETTAAGDKRTSGNGSLMRLGPIPVFFANDVNAAMDAARLSSLSTHQGEEAAECCRLLAFLCVHAISMNASSSASSTSAAAVSSSSSSSSSSGVTPTPTTFPSASAHPCPTDPIQQQALAQQCVANKQLLLTSVINSFTSPCYAVMCVARSEQEKRHPENEWMRRRMPARWNDSSSGESEDDERQENAGAGAKKAKRKKKKQHHQQEDADADADETYLADRNWNWRIDEQYRYSATRARQQPGYVGSYAMDALTMALHCVYSTQSFTEAVIKAANVRGDSDSVAAVTGQLAGAIYGAHSIPFSWIQAVQQWDQGGRIAFSAYALYTKEIEPYLRGEVLQEREWLAKEETATSARQRGEARQ